MHYGILGTTTAHHDDGTPVPLGGARLRALLTALVLRQGRPVPADLLVDEVWGADPPQDSAAALQTLVGRLRRTVGREQIGSGPAGYWLTAAGSDLTSFQRLAAEGRRAAEQDDHALAAERLTAALALWRGPALADLPDRGGSATRLEAERDETRRHRITAELALGRAAEVTAELAELCEIRPLDEPLAALLIRALRDGGRTAEALQRYELTRRALADQLGADPGEPLRALHRDLLNGAEPAPAAPVRPRTAGNLRPRLTSFVGRGEDLAAVRAALATGRLTTLTGPGGSGKTRLSVEAALAEQADGSWPDGVWQVELASLDDPAATPGAVLSALGLREIVLHTGGAVGEAARVHDPVRRLVEHCAPRRMLLVLDNCEHLIQAAAELADQLLAECPGLTVLATSREPLGVPGEALLPVEPLPGEVALRLLAERGAAARPGFDPAEDPAACAEICRRLDGLPLAIELAAARLRGLTPRQLADRLDSRFALLTAGSRTLLPRQQTLRAVVDWSWDLLDKRERAILRRLAVFAGGCTLEDAEQVCADEAEVPREEVADLLLSLVDKSLLVAGLGAHPRYRMLETILEYAGERLVEADEPEVTLRHVRHYRELVRTAELRVHGPEQLYWLDVLEREQGNIRAALRRAIDRGEEQEALVLALGMSWFWQLRDYRSEAHAWYDEIVALGPDVFAEGARRPVPLTEGPLDVPLPMSEDMLDEARRQVQLFRLVTIFTGNMEDLGGTGAVELARRVLAVYTPDLPQSYRFPVLMRVFAAFLAGQMDSMKALLDDAVAGAREHGRPGDLAFVLQIRARMLNDWVGGLPQATLDSAEALEIFTRIGDKWGRSEALAAQAEAMGNTGDAAGAAETYRQSIRLAEELGAHHEVPMLKVRLGEAVLQSDPELGEALVRGALAEVAPGSQSADGAQLFGNLVLCSVHARRGEYPEALSRLDHLMASRQLLGPLVPEVFTGLLLCVRSWVVARAGDPVQAMELLRQGRRQMRQAPGAAGVFAEHMTVLLLPAFTGTLLIIARLRDDLRIARFSAVLLGAHDRLHGPRGTFIERKELLEAQQAARELLGEAEYLAAHAEGGCLGLAETAALMDEVERF
ncbi:putative ATPase [Kitasatospora gansuensis]|uniref:Putative ATPase n=1 Tax=Kitasatospora gansuensis TaxID=258050 RepID=A0A7W7WK37_9ACTN|nr:BTAD domain-containing putative transcriptional regulator [Kitasatospora gansuensis]MBB4949813.1 putative ATPase [Kitasatospora gansuensis]